MTKKTRNTRKDQFKDDRFPTETCVPLSVWNNIQLLVKSVRFFTEISKELHIISHLYFTWCRYFRCLPMRLFCSCRASACLSSKHAPALAGQSLCPPVTSASKSVYGFPLLCGPRQVRGSSLLHGILGVIVLQRPWVWNPSSLMHRSALVNRLPKHYGGRMEVF